MNTETQSETRVRRPRSFDRNYSYAEGKATLNSTFDAGFALDLELTKVPEGTAQGFILRAVADYVVKAGNEVLRNPLEGESEDANRARALEAVNEAYAEIVEGKVDFTSTADGGETRSVIAALGQVLFEAGKTFVKNQRGETLSFNDLHSARAAVKALYNDTEPKGPFEPVIKNGQPEFNKDGSPKLKAVKPDSHLTGRMIFNAICETAGIKEKLEALTTKKKPAVAVEMG